MLSDFKPLVLNKNFRYLWISQILSQLTINIMNFLLLIRLYVDTGSTIATSLLWISYAIPAVVIGPIAAAAVDIFERRKVLIITNLLQAATIFFYALSHESSLFLLFGVAMAYSFLNQFYVPAEFSALPSIVNKAKLAHANGLFFMTQTASLIVGYGIAGVMFHLLGFNITLYICALLLFMAFVSVSFLPEMLTGAQVPEKFETAIVSFFKGILEGYKFITKDKRILYPFLLLMCLQISISIVVVNVPVFAKEILQVPFESLGYVLAIPLGLGAGLSGLTIPKLMKKAGRKKKLIETNLFFISILLFILIFILETLPANIRIALGVFSIMATGFSFVGILIPVQTFLQEKTPGGFRGRVFGNYWFLVTAITIFPVIFSGAITDFLGIKILLFMLFGLTVAILTISKKYGQRVIENSF